MRNCILADRLPLEPVLGLLEEDVHHVNAVVVSVVGSLLVVLGKVRYQSPLLQLSVSKLLQGSFFFGFI